MANKTTRNARSVEEFLAGVENETRRADAAEVCELLRRVSGDEPAMWGDSIVGFGERHLVYSTGRELDWFDIGFSPRKQDMTIYINEGFEEHGDLLARLGKHSTSVSCLHVKRLADVDPGVLEELVRRSVAHAREG